MTLLYCLVRPHKFPKSRRSQSIIMACSQCASGSLHEGTPIGRVDTVRGLPTYISEPPTGQSPKGIVVIIPDAFGWEFNNNRILADKYAERLNARVYLPEFMNGNSMSPSMLTTMDKLLGKGSMIGKASVWVSCSSIFVANLRLQPASCIRTNRGPPVSVLKPLNS